MISKMIIKSNFSINHDSVLCHFDISVTYRSTWMVYDNTKIID